MPMYTFRCPTCGNEFELFLRASEALRGVQCPACGQHTLQQAADGSAAAPGPACDLSKKT
jgi:putative FmdB family regulatory protein